jgi:hypothetical protein
VPLRDVQHMLGRTVRLREANADGDPDFVDAIGESLEVDLATIVAATTKPAPGSAICPVCGLNRKSVQRLAEHLEFVHGIASTEERRAA